VSDIGDVDSYFERSVVVLDDVKSIVEVLSRLGVDSEHSVVSEVSTNFRRLLTCKINLVRILFSLEDAGDSRSGMVQGVGGRHLTTLSEKSVHGSSDQAYEVRWEGGVPSVEKLQSLSNALVSVSISPTGPSSSTRVPNGWREVIGHRLMHATKRRSEYLSGRSIKSRGACSVAIIPSSSASYVRYKSEGTYE
jgi:hypothetical protein